MYGLDMLLLLKLGIEVYQLLTFRRTTDLVLGVRGFSLDIIQTCDLLTPL